MLSSSIKKRPLGQTGIEVSVVGLGTVKFGRNQGVKYPQAFALPSDAEAAALLVQAQEAGINLLDTAPAYGESEERLGKLLLGQRHEWVLATKAGEDFKAGESLFDFSPQALRLSVERSLKRLRTDYLDLVLIHSNGDDLKIIQQDAALDTLSALKEAGKIRAFGMSTKTIAGGLQAVQDSDVVMVTYNPHEYAEQPVLAQAAKSRKGVFIKKAFASGHLNKLAQGDEDPIKAALRFIFAEAGVSSIILGTINPAHLEHNLSCVRAVLN